MKIDTNNDNVALEAQLLQKTEKKFDGLKYIQLALIVTGSLALLASNYLINLRQASEIQENKFDNCTQINDLMNARGYCPTEFFLQYFDEFHEGRVLGNLKLFNDCWDAKLLSAANVTGLIFNQCFCNLGLADASKDFAARSAEHLNFISKSAYRIYGEKEGAKKVKRYSQFSSLSLLKKLGCSYDITIKQNCSIAETGLYKKEVCKDNGVDVSVPFLVQA